MTAGAGEGAGGEAGRGRKGYKQCAWVSTQSGFSV